ncbi:flavinator of succinate dehydrogenase family protein [Neorickettsia helminthoeca str. Oregon]|uniref:FAD assembly factor SdhE n=1 Tax=Neorickettsia helminthoeca str. Oregon TaxID=1286528 RepID=X5GXM9_9RICK|nr:succinate dehydrogenase assembly factor 2 [Neorickettsia helminthoeca]AHX11817.1 flavinator of succinate dehydrogenase family protein [Neorickettsia helminthoeca str. Oregon]
MKADLKRKRILYRSTHRGCKETDILLGGFAEKNFGNLTDHEVEQFERILELTDSFIFDCYQGRVNPPEDLELLTRMVNERNGSFQET